MICDDFIRESPQREGKLVMIVRRPRVGVREVLDTAELDLLDGLVGDIWKMRRSWKTRDGKPHPDMQITMINARVLELLKRDRDQWTLAGDQLVVDLDLSVENLPTGTQLAIGSARVEVTAEPHTGCKKFAAHFGVDAVKWVNSPIGRQLRLRGLNGRVIQSGWITVGDVVKKM
jgi:MOSC domain-containing protein